MDDKRIVDVRAYDALISCVFQLRVQASPHILVQ